MPWAGKCTGCYEGPHCGRRSVGDRLGGSSREQARTSDLDRLAAGLTHVARDEVVYERRVERVAFDRMHARRGASAPAATHGRLYDAHDDCPTHTGPLPPQAAST